MQNDLYEKTRHSLAHVLAHALLRLYPDAKLGIGPVVENGFYYEVETEKELTTKDFPDIEEEMWSIIKANYPITQIYISKEEAFNLLLHQGQIYKTEILEEIASDEVSIFKTGEEFLDLCSGPHVTSTGQVGYFKLTKIEEGYWKNLPSRPKMQKIFGVSFPEKKDLLNYLEELEQLKEIDHRKLGQKLNYFHTSSNIGEGLPIWLPKGNKLRKLILDHLSAQKELNNFEEVHTPHIISSTSDLLNISTNDIKTKTFPEIKDLNNKYVLRAEATPMHYQVFKAKTRSYRELPLKIYEHGYIFRNEDEHELHGLTKTKVFTNESNHIFCSEEQVFQELLSTFQLTTKVLADFGFKEYKIQLSTNSDNKDSRFLWSYKVLLKLITTLKLLSRQVEDKSTENGPKIELFVKDIFGKEWQLSSIQLDIFSTLKQGLNYVKKDGKNSEIIVIRSTLIGSVERFIGLLLEKTRGNLPLWLAPEQIRILPVSKRYNLYADHVAQILIKNGYRISIDKHDETLQSRIKYAQEDKIPFMVIVGSKEESSQSLSIRPREGQDLGLMKVEEFLDMLKRE